jgi:hypothetical protein
MGAVLGDIAVEILKRDRKIDLCRKGRQTQNKQADDR